MDFFISYLPAIVTTIIIAPLGGYVGLRLKALATKEDFNGAIDQLERSTKAVESIKSLMNEKYWVKQQIWETKRVAYEELTTSLYLTQKYLDGLVAYFKNYVDCFVHIGYQSGAPYEIPEEEEHQRSYEEYIEGEQKSFMEEYESVDSQKERKHLLSKASDSFINLESIFSVKSIYLHSELKSIEHEIEVLKGDIFNDQLRQEDYESQPEFFERLLKHHLSSQQSLSNLIEKTKDLAVKDLRLEFGGTST